MFSEQHVILLGIVNISIRIFPLKEGIHISVDDLFERLAGGPWDNERLAREDSIEVSALVGREVHEKLVVTLLDFRLVEDHHDVKRS